MAERLLEVSNIETRYGLSQVLFGISLAIAPGEMVTLMGRNGMGKTTTVRSIMGLTPAMAGSIRFDGREIADLSARDRSNPFGEFLCHVGLVDIADVLRLRRNHAGIHQRDKHKRDLNPQGQQFVPRDERILSRHKNVTDDDIGLKESGGFHELCAVSDGTDDFKL